LPTLAVTKLQECGMSHSQPDFIVLHCFWHWVSHHLLEWHSH